MFAIEGISLITATQSILLIISALLIIIAAVGLLRIDKDMPNVVYARIHILGMIDVAGIIAFIGLGQYLLALIYFFLAPLLAHALANGYFHGEDTFNNPVLNPDLLIEESEDENLNLISDSDSGDLETGLVDVSDPEEDDSCSEDLENTDSEDADNKTTEENDEENLNNSEGDDND